MTKTNLPQLKAKDYASDQEVRWCPGCGDYSILNAVQRTCAKLQLPIENTVFISGIGCSSRFPYYMNTYGFHTIHGRAPGFVTGLKIANPQLDVWMVTGDGDGLSIGGNHMMHLLRRNVTTKVLLFNNRIYGLTKGQFSPTSESGKKTKSSPQGSVEEPVNPVAFALACRATFVGRSADKDRGLPDILEQASYHKGTAFTEIYQNCNIFNDGAFDALTGRDTRDDRVLYVTHGEPMLFGKELSKGLVFDQGRLKAVDVADVGEEALLVHDETDHGMATLLAGLEHPLPEPFGIIYRQPSEAGYEQLVQRQVDESRSNGVPSLEDLFNEGEMFEVA